MMNSSVKGRFAAFLLTLFALAGCGAPARVGAPAAPAPAAPTAPAGSTVVELPAQLGTVALDTVRAGPFDNGKMWTFEYPPLDYFREEYGFAPDSAWFREARLGALRLRGCSASFVSPHGLVLTNHHCARGSVAKVSQAGEDLLDRGFYASSLDEERPAGDATADQLIAIVDVTDDMDAALAAGESDEQAKARIAERLAPQYRQAGDSIVVEVIELWNGARYSAYIFRRYTDLRVVLAPELKIGFFGGDPDNFTYPRYNLDMSFYRIYDAEGNPLESEHYFTWSEKGASDGDAVFVIGNPGGSSRLQTVAQLEYRRKVRDRIILDYLSSRADLLQAFYDEHPEEGEKRDLRNTIFSLRNSEKAYRGMWEGLFNPVYMARRRDAERQFREAIEADSALEAKYGGLLERMAAIQEEKMKHAAEFGAFIGIGNPSVTSPALWRGFLVRAYLQQRGAGTPEDALAGLEDNILSIADLPPALHRRLLTARLRDFQRHFGPKSEIVQRILQGRTPEAAAEAILAESLLADSASTAAALSDGRLTPTDPAVQMVEAIFDRFLAYQQAAQRLSREEAGLARELGRARFDIYGTSIPPDATFSLRIADGVVKGYPYNGTYAPSHTTFYGLYDRYYSHGGGEWDLPARWLKPPPSFDLSTPLNFVLTADVIGGNSGSPVINPELEVVGLIFDGNIESLPGDYIYDPEVNRAVAVDVRGILEALDDIYDADRIALELTTGKLVPTEEEADAALAGQRTGH